MRTHKSSVALITAVIFSGLSGCNAESPTNAAVGKGVAFSVGASPERPLSGTCETAFAPPTLPPPPVIRQVDQGFCTLAHLGRTAIYAVQDIDIVSGTQQSVEITFTTANGDILRASNVGTNSPIGPGVAFQGTMTFTGGTGRFANVTGEAQVNGAANFVTNTASFRLDGWIVYDGSQSKK